MKPNTEEIAAKERDRLREAKNPATPLGAIMKHCVDCKFYFVEMIKKWPWSKLEPRHGFSDGRCTSPKSADTMGFAITGLGKDASYCRDERRDWESIDNCGMKAKNFEPKDP
jgi:hypothetical protein